MMNGRIANAMRPLIAFHQAMKQGAVKKRILIPFKP